MIFGGLEIVAGGYFAHKYYKNKNEKRRLEEEAQTRRNNTFPSNCPSSYPLDRRELHQQSHRPQQVTSPQKYACHAATAPRPHYETQPRPQQLRPKQCHAPSFNIPRRPVSQRKPEIVVQPSLQRADSMATLSRMPIANGYRPSNSVEQNLALQPHMGSLSPSQHSPYGNAAFSVSSPAFGAAPTSPPTSFNMVSDGYLGGSYTGRDNWETNEHGVQRYSAYAPTEASTQLGERDPPPPYAP